MKKIFCVLRGNIKYLHPIEIVIEHYILRRNFYGAPVRCITDVFEVIVGSRMRENRTYGS